MSRKGLAVADDSHFRFNVVAKYSMASRGPIRSHRVGGRAVISPALIGIVAGASLARSAASDICFFVMVMVSPLFFCRRAFWRDDPGSFLRIGHGQPSHTRPPMSARAQ